MNITTRGKKFTGTVVSAKMQKSAIVEWERRKYLAKYERYERRKTRIAVHNPDSVRAQEGDLVEIEECRPLSKTKNFIITKVLGKEHTFTLQKDLAEEGKFKKIKKQEQNEAKNAEVAAKSDSKKSAEKKKAEKKTKQEDD